MHFHDVSQSNKPEPPRSCHSVESRTISRFHGRGAKRSRDTSVGTRRNPSECSSGTLYLRSGVPRRANGKRFLGNHVPVASLNCRISPRLPTAETSKCRGRSHFELLTKLTARCW